jgi:hypothetical protein
VATRSENRLTCSSVSILILGVAQAIGRDRASKGQRLEPAHGGKRMGILVLASGPSAGIVAIADGLIELAMRGGTLLSRCARAVRAPQGMADRFLGLAAASIQFNFARIFFPDFCLSRGGSTAAATAIS